MVIGTFREGFDTAYLGTIYWNHLLDDQPCQFIEISCLNSTTRATALRFNPFCDNRGFSWSSCWGFLSFFLRGWVSVVCDMGNPWVFLLQPGPIPMIYPYPKYGYGFLHLFSWVQVWIKIPMGDGMGWRGHKHLKKLRWRRAMWSLLCSTKILWKLQQ